MTRSYKAPAGLALLLIAAMGLFLLFRGASEQRLTAATVGGPFALSDSADRTVTDRDFRGRYLLVYFGYTACPDVCPTTLVTVVRALALLGHRGDGIQPVFITIDPAHDTPAIIGRYVAAFSPRLIGLTGSAAALRRIEAAYHVVVRPRAGSIDHSAVLYLMGPDGQFLAPLPTDAAPAALAAALSRSTPSS